MAALDNLSRAGLTVEAAAGKLRVSPQGRITPELRTYIITNKAKLLAELSAAHEIASSPWLHLLVLIDGKVIQRCGEQATCHVEEMARQQYGDDLAAVVAVPNFQRPLSGTEIAQALAGTLATPEPVAPPPPSSAWLARVARLLGIRPTELLENGHLEQHDLHELAYTDAVLVADHIRSSPAWINRQ